MIRKNLLLLVPILLAVSLVAAKIIADKRPVEPLPYQQGDEYTADWSKVDSLVAKELPKDALVLVDAIHAKAVASSNYAQIIRSLLYLEQLRYGDEEESQIQAINDLEQQLSKTPYPAKPILQSMLADMYWNYYRQNRYKILNRTVTDAPAGNDISTWDAAKFAEKTSSLYMASVQPADSLQRTQLSLFDQILIFDSHSKDYRPTLYDLLMYKAIDFFQNSESGLTQPAEAFVMNDPRYLGSAEDFIRININTPDSANFKVKALKLMQAFTAYQLSRGSATSLVDLEVKRLQFAKQNSVLEGKDSLYLLTLQQLERQFKKDSISAMVGLEIATQLNNRSSKYNALTAPQYLNDKVEAIKKCNEVIERFYNTSWASRCNNLVKAIQARSLSFDIEKINVPNQPFRALVSYKNTPKLYFRLINKIPLNNRNNADSILDELLAQPILQAWALEMPGTSDYRSHSSEIKVPAQKIGQYYLLAATDSNFVHDKDIVASSFFSISNIGYTSRTTNNAAEVLVHDRNNGHPLKGAKVDAYTNKYDYRTRTYVTKPLGSYKTDADGRVAITGITNTNDNQLSFTIHYKEDSLATGDYQYFSYYQQSAPQIQDKVFFFLDRGIYRPGQTVYFKGLAISTNGKDNHIRTKAKEIVELIDANGQKVSSLTLTSNDYGSFNGTFTLPSTGLTGNFSIRTSTQTGYKDFRVEDYKRPKFEVKFDPIKGSFRLGDKVTVTGKAISYSGVPVDGAQVQYRVTRQAYFPYWDWYKWRYPAPYSASKEIISDTLITKTDGSFSITFTAINDDKIPSAQLPEYSFGITADVTDQNNETQSANTNCTVGTVALRADMNLNDNYSTTDTDKVSLTTENLNGEFEPAQGTIQIYRLQDPDLVLRKRLWNMPDQYAMDEKTYHRAFPNDIYKDEDDYKTWQRGDKVLDITFDSNKDKQFGLNNLSQWKQGEYVAELETKDHYGKAVKLVKYFAVQNPKTKEMPLTSPWWVQQAKTYAQPGDKAQVWIGSSEKDILVLYEVVLQGNIIHKEWVKLNREKRLLELPIEERYRGGITIKLLAVIDSRIYTEDISVMVPYPSKELSLKVATFRDKLTPGDKEHWKLTVTGPKGEKVAAEMLSSMYDASLDAFTTNNWYLDLPQNNNFDKGYIGNWDTNTAYAYIGSSTYTYDWRYQPTSPYIQGYDRLNWFICTMGGYYDLYRHLANDGMAVYSRSENGDRMVMEKSLSTISGVQTMAAPMDGTYSVTVTDANGASTATKGGTDTYTYSWADSIGGGEHAKPTVPIVPRTNFNETAFFFPELHTDSSGNVVISFTVPDALTRWQFQAFAHTKDLQYGFLTKEAIAQKDLMVVPNAPRFLREGDTLELTAKVSSLVDNELNGQATLTLTDPFTNQTINQQFGSEVSGKVFNVKKGQSTTVSWRLKVPEGLGAVSYRITAKAGNFSDGEEAALPILTNRMLVTETLPINIKGGQQKTFTLDKLLHSGSSSTLTQHQLTFELTSNPAWYALQSLPYIMEYPYECSEQLFSRFYANSVATHVVNSNTLMKQVFDTWKSSDALVSNLEKNQDLKQLLLEETPWVLQAKDETERKKRVALLFDLNKMSNERATALNKLQDKQAPNGGWPWFKGMPDNRFITQYIITGMGKLQHMGALDIKKDAEVNGMVNKGINYLDARIAEDYADLLRYKADLKANNLSEDQVQYLYARSFFADKPIPESARKAYDYYRSQAQTFWTKRSKYSEAMVALALYRTGDSKTANDILRSLKQTAIRNEEQGMYWKDNAAGYYWYQAPIEAQAAMIEAFSEIAKDNAVVDDLRTWLLKQKQVQDWGTTKATADACYALLLSGTDWLSSTEVPQITVGTTKLQPGKNVPKAEAGTGYFRTEWTGKDIHPDMGKVTISKQGKGLAWGALYWQYFEQLDKITPASTPLQLTKQLYLQQNTATGPKLTPIGPGTTLKPGDLVKVRITLRVDRDMDFVQMKDMRAAGFEPTSTLSEYQYQGGLGYYQSTRDAATNFFFDRLPKGSWVFEYGLRVSQRGSFSNGITTIQSMYAPEFTSHSQGVRVTVQ